MRRLFTDLKIMLLANLWIVPVLAALVFALFYFVAPPPPMHATLATGNPEGGYHAFALKLQKELAKDGFTLTLLPSTGSQQNLELLLQDHAELALVQSGHELNLDADELKQLVGLGVMYREPLWLFHRKDRPLTSLLDLTQQRIAIGNPSNGAGAVLRELLGTYQLNLTELPSTWLPSSGKRAADALLAGQLDGAFFIGPAENSTVQRLAADPALTLLSLPHSQAYQARLPDFSQIEVPAGMLNLPNNSPDHRLQTLGPSATLVANKEFHPSLTPLILQAARNVLKDGNLVDSAGSYPQPPPPTLPELDEAKYFYKNGLPILQRYLPFRIASLADRYIILAIPLLVLLFPLAKAIGPIYQWRIRARIYRWYKHLREIDRALHKGTLHDLEEEISKLQSLELELAQIQVPLSYSNELYQLHMHVRYMIERLHEWQTRSNPPD